MEVLSLLPKMLVDDTSRGMPIADFLQSERWKRGPDFLWKVEPEWPIQPEFTQELTYEDPEVKKSEASCSRYCLSSDKPLLR